MFRIALATLIAGLLVAARPGVAAESTVRGLVYTTQSLVLTTRNLVYAVEDLYRVVESAKEVVIELPADVLFDFDKADIRSDAVIALSEAARILREQAKGKVRIEGHTDAKGSKSYNQKLSVERAESVKQWLAEKEGLGDMKFEVKGFGAGKPVAPNTLDDGSDNPEGRQLNRRVALVFKK